MILPDSDQIRTAFRQSYLSQHQTLDGWEDEFKWWINPDLQCANLVAGRGKPRCKTPCEYCIGKYNKKIRMENRDGSF